jgi:hypothetical protein
MPESPKFEIRFLGASVSGTGVIGITAAAIVVAMLVAFMILGHSPIVVTRL